MPLDGDVGETPGAALIEVEHARPSRRDRFEILGPKRVPNPGSRASMREPAPFDDDRFRDARQLQDRRSLDGGAGADADVLLVIGRKSRELDVEHVRPGGSAGKRSCPFSFVVERSPVRQSAPAS